MANVSKRYLMQVAAHNLGIVMRKVFGVGTPRGLQGGKSGPFVLFVLPKDYQREFRRVCVACMRFTFRNPNWFRPRCATV